MEEPTIRLGAAESAVIHDGRYRLEARLGRGGMGEVWQAFDLKLQVEVALKFLLPDLLIDPTSAELLRSEVRAARDVASPHVCRVFDLVEQDDREIVSMEYIDGASLREILQQRGPLELREATEIAAQLLSGLEAIHESGLIHCDLKPDNIMITRSGRVVVMDFGVARARPQPGEAKVDAGVIAGTPAYMSPEQMQGEDLDARSDLFATGIILAEMLAVGGESDPEFRKKLLRGVREDPPSLPEGPWQVLVTQAVAPGRLDRFASAAEMARALEVASSRAAGDDGRTPYPGLVSFSESDAEYFFGREIEVEQIWKKLDRFSMLAVIGPSGVGKSSFLRAGLFPAAPEGWRCVVCSPGRAPFTALAQNLVADFSGQTELIRDLMTLDDVNSAIPVLKRWRQRYEHVLLVFDQFEELFTLNPPEVQARFAELVGRLAVEADIHVLVSMRDDFFFHCHRYETLTPLFSSVVPLGPMLGADLRRALVQPALSCGYRFEDEALVKEMLAEVSDERGALPLLAFAAARLWERRDRTQGLLLRTAYEDTGQVGGALALHAEVTLQKIGTAKLETVREVFRNLITAEGTRVARTREELLSIFDNAEDAERVLQHLIDARLLTSYEEHVDVLRLEEKVGSVAEAHRIEIVHESLLKAWPRLVRWQAQDAEGALLRDQLRQAAQVWQERGRSPDLLWTGTAYQEFELWRARYPGGLTAAEENFARAMVQRDKQRRRRRRIATGVAFAVLTIILVVVGISRQQAVQEARRAEANELLALGRQETNPFDAFASALASLERMDTLKGRRFAIETLWKMPLGFMIPKTWGAWTVDMSADGNWLASGHYDGDVRIWPMDGGEPIQLNMASEHFVQNIRFNPEFPLLVAASQDLQHGVRVWSYPDTQLVFAPELESMTDAYWGPGGQTLVTATYNGPPDPRLISQYSLLWRSWSIENWKSADLGTAGTFYGYLLKRADPQGTRFLDWGGTELSLFHLDRLQGEVRSEALGHHNTDINQAQFDPSGEKVISIDDEGEIRLWTLNSTPEPTFRIVGHQSGHNFATIDPIGNHLATCGDGGASLWDLSGPPGTEPIALPAVGQIDDLVFHPRGNWLIRGGPNSWIIFYSLAHRYPLVLRGHAEDVKELVVDPEGEWLVSAGGDRTVRCWSLSPDAKVTAWTEKLSGEIFSMSSDRIGDQVLVGLYNREITLLSSQTGDIHPDTDRLRASAVMDSISGVLHAVALSADGKMVAASGGWNNHGVIGVWNLVEDREWTLDAGDGDAVIALEFTSDDRLIAGSGNGVRLWDMHAHTSELIVEGSIRSVDVSEDGQRILSAGPSGVFLHDRRFGESRELGAHAGQNVGAINTAGDWVVTGQRDTGEIRYGQATGEEPHLLLYHESGVSALAFDPLGRWIISGGRDGTIRFWPVPTGRPFHTLPYEEFLRRLRALTNMRVVRDLAAEDGYTREVEPFPGWAEAAPTW